MVAGMAPKSSHEPATIYHAKQSAQLANPLPCELLDEYHMNYHH